jgi:DNA-binding MarR family transcriptional regulator
VTIDEIVEGIQFAYPQIYYACHTRHERRRSTAHALSRRDSEILVHLDRREPTRLSALARHMDVSASTLSEAVKHLVEYGYVARSSDAGGDRRATGLTLTAKGTTAVRATSVLEASRLSTALKRLTAAERARVLDGLALLAAACRGRSARRLEEER